VEEIRRDGLKTKFAKSQEAIGRGGIRTHTPVAQEGILSPKVDSATTDSIIFCDDDPSSARSTISSKNQIDANLQRLIDAWPTLPAKIRASIIAILEIAL
jgi:hypothetical protein